MSDFLGQLQELIGAAERNQADAENWRGLVAMLGERGYGPRITPEQVASACVDFGRLAEMVASTQEVPAPGAMKRGAMPRRKILDADIKRIHELDEQGFTVQQIAGELNIVKSAISAYIGHE